MRMDQNQIEKYRRIFVPILKPFLEMLEFQKKNMDYLSWLEVVKHLEVNITQKPEQYLGKEYPTQSVLEIVVAEIFREFVDETKTAIA